MADVIWQKATSRDPILVEGEVLGGQRWYRSKERWWFHIGSPLWPLRYL